MVLCACSKVTEYSWSWPQSIVCWLLRQPFIHKLSLVCLLYLLAHWTFFSTAAADHQIKSSSATNLLLLRLSPWLQRFGAREGVILAIIANGAHNRRRIYLELVGVMIWQPILHYCTLITVPTPMIHQLIKVHVVTGPIDFYRFCSLPVLNRCEQAADVIDRPLTRTFDDNCADNTVGI